MLIQVQEPPITLATGQHCIDVQSDKRIRDILVLVESDTCHCGGTEVNVVNVGKTLHGYQIQAHIRSNTATILVTLVVEVFE